MNKNELIKELAARTNLTQKEAKAFLDAFCEIITEALAKGDKVAIMNFGTWEVRERAERKGRNPRTKEEIIIPATKVPRFSPGKMLKEAVKK